MAVKLCTKCQIAINNWAVRRVHDRSTICEILYSEYHTRSTLEASASEGLTTTQTWFTFLSAGGQHTCRASHPTQLVLAMKLAETQACYCRQEAEVSTGCSESLDLAKSWLTSCTGSHPYCQVQSQEEHPTRLLSIGSGVLQLVLASQIASHAPYATLSHCWGNSIPLKLVKDNLTNFRTSISHSELCRTFSDAIIAAKHLGLNYIWIDSLCIIQDDPEDWLRESAKMSSIYSGSTINIAATSAEDGTMGCFSNAASWGIRLPVPMREGTRFWDVSLSDPSGLFTNEPLLRRARVFQERFLAPRTLHFTKYQMFWECNEGYRCGMSPGKEMYPGGLLKNALLSSDIWYPIVETYSTGNLTYATDRLVAISGVSQWLQAQTHDDYLAGMWREDLGRQLCWYTKEQEADSPFLFRPKDYLAPSWSWASILGSVKFFNPVDSGQRTTLVRVLSAYIVLEDEKYKFGKVTSGILRLSVEYLLCVTERTTGPTDEIGGIYTLSGDFISRPEWINWDCPKDPRNKLYLLPITHTIYVEDDTEVIYYRPGTNFEFNTDELDGIILESTETSKRAEYRRVGYFRYADMFYRDDDESLYEEVEESGTKLRVINII